MPNKGLFPSDFLCQADFHHRLLLLKDFDHDFDVFLFMYYGNTCGGRADGQRPQGFRSLSQSFHPVFIKLGEYVG